MEHALVLQIMGLLCAFIASIFAFFTMAKRHEAQKLLEAKLAEILNKNSSGFDVGVANELRSTHISCSKKDLPKYRQLIELATKELNEEHKKSIEKALYQPSKMGKESYICNTVKQAMQLC